MRMASSTWSTLPRRPLATEACRGVARGDRITVAHELPALGDNDRRLMRGGQR